MITDGKAGFEPEKSAYEPRTNPGNEWNEPEISAMSVGTNIELRLKNQERTRGARGAMPTTGFVLVDSRGGERRIAFDDIDSVKPYVHKWKMS